MHHSAHTYYTVGFQLWSMPKCVHVCSEWVLLGKAKATAELVCWRWVSMRQLRVGLCTGHQRGCGVLHVPLMSFLGQARPWGELISKQATERSPYSPLLLLLLLLLLALQLITLFLLLSIVFSSYLCLSVNCRQYGAF